MGRETKTGGREATTGVIPGAYALSVGKPDKPLPEGWEWKPLTALARLESGHTPSRRHPEYWEGDIPWIGIRDATSNYGRTIYDTQQHTNQRGIDNSSARVLPKGTVCLSRTASVGYVVVMGRPMATSQDFVNWVCTDRLNNHFLKYILIAERESLNMYSMGTTHQTIYYPEVKAFYIAVPSRPEQDAIAALLSSLDDKIELNQRMNETLETMAQAIFKDWFVDFGPTRAKTEGRAPYLAPDIWDLFPDRLDDENKPERWSTPSLLEVCELKRGYDLPSRARIPGNTPIISSSGPSGWHQEAKVRGPGIVTGRYGTIGQVFRCDTDFWPLNTTLYVRDFKGHPYWFVYHTLMCLDFNKYSDKAAVPGINRNALHLEQVVVPTPALLARFEALANPLMQKAAANTRENENLASLRDLLLARLMSGEIRVREAEKVVEAVA